MWTDKQYKDLDNKLGDMLSALQTNSSVVTKSPSNHIVFKNAEIGNARTICRGYDNNFYLINMADRTLEVYEDITANNTPIESGISWNNELYGTPVQIVSMLEGITIFTNDLEEPRTGRIYHMPSIQDTPTLVYEAPVTDGTHWWNPNFGIKSHWNGINGIILAGIYGRGASKKDLLLSVNGGQSFEVIDQSKNADPDTAINSHWHDVDIDPFNGFLWASEGDGNINRAIHFYDDLGGSRYTLAAGVAQPTAIISFPKRVIFGNDTDFTGLRYFDVPQLATNYNDYKDEVKPLMRFKQNVIPSLYYAHSPIKRGLEGYMSFNVIAPNQPSLILGTGDGGKSVHFVNMAHKGNIDTTLWHVDDKYIYGTKGDWNNPGRTVIYAEKPEWI
ncbi:hypothetical protein [Bacillus sp. B15-48]|uniref:hypothetical protein n=1 Tax=Bacillus sp. B15-48 TaxID=1548601 RepID=UPI00193F96C2|nr:hypothetical protein [Bacillus sp. B15-48]MBM4762698.1 hypothetical protein [Bacillus sp. B15-48]